MLSIALFSAAASVPTTEIAPGVMMPQTNLGTCCGSSPKVGLSSWMKYGGYGIDTSDDYGTQPDIAKGIKGVDREKLFILTKCSGSSKNCLDVTKSDIKQLGVSYVDLVLIHHPGSSSANSKQWSQLEDALAQNLTRAIGVSNFNVNQLKALQKTAKAKISLNQCSMSLKSHNDEVIKYCQDNGITYEAYDAMKGCPTSDSTLKKIASSHNKSPQQVCLRYIIDRGCVMAVGTGSSSSTVDEYAKADLDIFDFKLSDSELSQLNGI